MLVARTLHHSWAWVVIVSNAVAGVLCLVAYWLPAFRKRPLWWFVIVAEVAVFVQAILGVVLLNADKLESPKFHMLYGFSAIFTVGILYAYRQQLKQYEHLLYGLGGLFIMGLGIRALFV